MKVLRIGIAPMAAIKARAVAVGKGGKPKPGEPEFWFHSAQRLGRLIDNNWLLLYEIKRNPPQSMTELAKRTGRSGGIFR
jgi:predicted transcriptional regulator